MKPARLQFRPIILALLFLLGQLANAPAAKEATGTRNPETEARLKRDVTFLASDECQGRGPLTHGIDLAADYVAAEFKKAGLKPPTADGKYLQPFTMPGSVLKAPARLVLKGPEHQQIELRQGVQFQPLGLAGSGTVTTPAVFAGYGITAAPPLNYDDYAGLDAKGKVVILLRDTPRVGVKGQEAVFGGSRRQALGSLTQKLANAEKHGAVAVLFVNDADTARTGDDLLDFNYLALARPINKLPAFHVRRSVLETMLHASGVELPDLERDIDRDLRPRSRKLDWGVDLAISVERERVTLNNVVGVLDGSGPLANETVVVGAHYDHLGFGSTSSMAHLKKMAVHHGADDNGSGTSGLLELARRFGSQANRQGRRLVFIAFSGEELGLYGSEAYCKNPLFPLKETAAMVNLDMIGRLRVDPKSHKDKLLIEGSGSAKAFNDLLEAVNRRFDFQMIKKASGAGPSDHASFYANKVPVLFFWTDYHADYHMPSDTADKINVAGMRKVVDLAEEIIQNLATATARPEYVQVKGGSGHGGSPGMGPRLGVRPADADGRDGVVVEEVVAGEPGDKAGIQKRDRIVQLAGRPIKTFDNLVAELANQMSGTTVEVGLVRDGKPLVVKVEFAFVPRLGIRPSYSDESDGVLLDGVSDGMPAAGAGLQPGDRIVEMGGKPLKDLEAYMRMLPGAVKGDYVDVVVLRDGKKLPVKIKVR